MSSQFHLRPVPDTSPSSSPTAESSSPGHQSPLKHSPVSTRPRRPLSPSSIRDLDLSRTSDMGQRKYPAPPTGHELMAMFPPAPPESPPETRGGPTSGFFQRQERAFFAQAGKELFRVRVEIDLPQHVPEMDGSHGKPLQRPRGDSGIPNTNGPRPWPPQLPAHPPANASSIPHHSNHSNHSTNHANHSNHAATHSNRSPVHVTPNAPPPPAASAAATTAVPAANATRPNVPNQRNGGGVPVTPVPLYPVNPHSPSSSSSSSTQHPNHPHSHSQPPPNLHRSPLRQPGIPLRTSPQESMPPSAAAATVVGQRPAAEVDAMIEDYPSEEAWRRPDPDAWRRPIPYAERRRAGKHTKRVIVR